MRISIRFSLLAVSALALLSACASSEPTSPAVTAPSTFATIQSRIFNQSCVQCHNTQDASINGGMDLSADHAYSNLVSAASHHSLAASAGYPVRVMPGHAAMSFIVSKLAGPPDSLGDRMPKGGHPLSTGKIAYIKQWIDSGAPKDGAVADTLLLNDTTVVNQAPLEPLALPAHGFQLHLAPFEIPAGGEREIFVYKRNPMVDTQYMSGVSISMREGSHHFILWNVDESEGLTEGEVREHSETEMQRNRIFVNGSQTLKMDFTFPPGIAVAIPPTYGFDFNSHYVNTTSDQYQGEAYVNINTVDKSAVQHLATPFLEADTQFQIPANATYTRNHYWPAFTKPSHLILLSSHAHKRMISFKIFKNGPTGELIYSSTDWHQPPTIALSVDFAKGERLYSETTWMNEASAPIRFGYTSEDEMNVIYGYYWQ